jgi:hypothetical protein
MPTDERLPLLATYKHAAKLVSERYFEVTPRGLETWGLPVRIIQRRRQVRVDALFAEAERRIAVAPSVMTGSPLHRDRRNFQVVDRKTHK